MPSCFHHVQFFMTPWTVAHQAPLFEGFSRQEYWSRLLENLWPRICLPAKLSFRFDGGIKICTDQIRSVTQSCPTLCDPMNRSTPGLPVHHQLPEFTQTHVHWVSDAIQPSHPLTSPSPFDKQNLNKRIQHHQISFATNTEETSVGRKETSNLKQPSYTYRLLSKSRVIWI